MALVLRSFKVPTAGFSDIGACFIHRSHFLHKQHSAQPVTVNRPLVLKNGFVVLFCLFLSCKDALPLAFCAGLLMHWDGRCCDSAEYGCEARLGTALGPCVRLARLHCPELSREGAGKKLVSFLHVNKLLTI